MCEIAVCHKLTQFIPFSRHPPHPSQINQFYYCTLPQFIPLSRHSPHPSQINQFHCYGFFVPLTRASTLSEMLQLEASWGGEDALVEVYEE